MASVCEGRVRQEDYYALYYSAPTTCSSSAPVRLPDGNFWTLHCVNYDRNMQVHLQNMKECLHTNCVF